MTDLADLKPGQRVRVTITGEGVVESSVVPALVLAIKTDSGIVNYYDTNTDGLSVELIEPPYIVGAIYEDDNGAFWEFGNIQARYDGGDAQVWYAPGCSTLFEFDRPARPLKRLVPESDG